jgi:zinc protease
MSAKFTRYFLLFFILFTTLSLAEPKTIYSKQLDFRLGVEKRAPGVYTLVHEDASDKNNNVENSSAKSILPLKKWTTSSGTPVFYAHEPDLPIIDIQVAFDAGSSRDESRQGLAKMTNEALSSGTQTKNVDELAAAFDDVGAQFSTAVSRDMAVIALRSLSDPPFFQPAFHAFSDILTQASFPAAEFKRIQKQLVSLLDEQEEQPASIASKTFYKALYDDDPYGHLVSGTKESITKLTVNDLHYFYHRFYTAQNAVIAIVAN